MKFRQIILNSLYWRGLYFLTVLLLNVVLSRYFKARGSGWIYYITNYFSFILLLASLCLESGMAFFASKKTIGENKLATLSVVWSVAISMVIMIVLFQYYSGAEQLFTRKQFLFFSVTYIPGVLFATFFSALFYAQLNYALPNLLLSITNAIVIISFLVLFQTGNTHGGSELFLKLYFFNFLFQGILLAAAYFRKNKLFAKWSLPTSGELRVLLRYSLIALATNVIYFLLYRIDYWFVERFCSPDDLGNYIQVSKLGQMFLLLPTIISSTIFPRTAAGYREQVYSALPSISKAILFLYLVLIVILSIFGQWLFPWVYGKTFNRMFIPFLVLIPGILSLSIMSLLSAYNAGRDRVTTNVKASLVGLVIIIAGDWYFIPKFGIIAAALVSSVGYGSCFFYLLWVFKKEYQVRLKDFFIPGIDDWKMLKKLFSSREGT